MWAAGDTRGARRRDAGAVAVYSLSTGWLTASYSVDCWCEPLDYSWARLRRRRRSTDRPT